ncbi:MAG: hypothetical protein RIB60_04055 [Phycisphaerales bacterium]
MSISGALLGKTIGGIAVTALAAFGGYNYATTGCVTGMGCGTGIDAAAVLPVADASTEGGSCCSLTEDAAEVTLVANETADSCCSLKDAAEVTQVADEAKDACCSLASAEVTQVVDEAKSSCCSEGADAAASVSTVALETEAAGASCCSADAESCGDACPDEGCDKADCCKKTEG